MSLSFEEKSTKMGLRIEIKRVLYDGYSPYQRITVFESEEAGRVLALNGCVMVAQFDEFIYHEMLVHPAFASSHIEDVLIIGGGDGGTLREVLKHKGVRRVRLVEIDREVIEVAKRYFNMDGVFKDSRVEIIIEDGVKYVSNVNDRFDLILVDSSDPVDFAASLYSKEFIDSLRSLRKGPGIVVFQAESPFFNSDAMVSLYKNVNNLFPHSGIYWTVIPSYPGALWTFVYGGDVDIRDSNKDDVEGLKFYNKDIHRAAFLLPPFLEEMLR